MTACGVAVEEVAFFNNSTPGMYVAFGYMDNHDVWHEVSVTLSRFSLPTMIIM